MKHISPELEKIIDKEYKVLDYGYIKILDYMGNDDSICESARISYLYDSPKSKDKDLINYLIENNHSSPMEACEIKFQIKLPIFVARQWCLSGDTQLHFKKPGEKCHRPEKLITIYNRFIKSISKANEVKKKLLVCYNEKEKKEITTTIKNMWETGIKDVYKIIINNGKKNTLELKITKDHPIYTKNGWKELQEICSKLPTKEDNSFICNEEILCLQGLWQTNDIEYSYNKINESTEIWTDCYINPERYLVSSQGRIKDKLYNKILKPLVKSDKRIAYNLYNRNIKNSKNKASQHIIARLMLMSFYPRDNMLELVARHLDDNKWNNSLNNLSWGTYLDNTNDRILNNRVCTKQRIPQFKEISRIEYVGQEMTYDIEVESPYHNFVAGGVVVHNCRHRTWSYNEVSGRYQELIDDKYIPEEFYKQSTLNHQSSDHDNKLSGRKMYENNFNHIFNTIVKDYNQFIKDGMAKEQARMILPLSQYTEMICKVDLHNLLHFLKLRNDSHSQYEIQEYAKILEDIVSKWVPVTYEAYCNFIKNSLTFSQEEQSIISKYLVEKKSLDSYIFHWSKRKRNTLINKLNKLGIK